MSFNSRSITVASRYTSGLGTASPEAFESLEAPRIREAHLHQRLLPSIRNQNRAESGIDLVRQIIYQSLKQNGLSDNEARQKSLDCTLDLDNENLVFAGMNPPERQALREYLHTLSETQNSTTEEISARIKLAKKLAQCSVGIIHPLLEFSHMGFQFFLNPSQVSLSQLEATKNELFSFTARILQNVTRMVFHADFSSFQSTHNWFALSYQILNETGTTEAQHFLNEELPHLIGERECFETLASNIPLLAQNTTHLALFAISGLSSLIGCAASKRFGSNLWGMLASSLSNSLSQASFQLLWSATQGNEVCNRESITQLSAAFFTGIGCGFSNHLVSHYLFQGTLPPIFQILIREQIEFGIDIGSEVSCDWAFQAILHSHFVSTLFGLENETGPQQSGFWLLFNNALGERSARAPQVSFGLAAQAFHPLFEANAHRSELIQSHLPTFPKPALSALALSSLLLTKFSEAAPHGSPFSFSYGHFIAASLSAFFLGINVQTRNSLSWNTQWLTTLQLKSENLINEIDLLSKKKKSDVCFLIYQEQLELKRLELEVLLLLSESIRLMNNFKKLPSNPEEVRKAFQERNEKHSALQQESIGFILFALEAIHSNTENQKTDFQKTGLQHYRNKNISEAKKCFSMALLLNFQDSEKVSNHPTKSNQDFRIDEHQRIHFSWLNSDLYKNIALQQEDRIFGYLKCTTKGWFYYSGDNFVILKDSFHQNLQTSETSKNEKRNWHKRFPSWSPQSNLKPLKLKPKQWCEIYPGDRICVGDFEFQIYPHEFSAVEIELPFGEKLSLQLNFNREALEQYFHSPTCIGVSLPGFDNTYNHDRVLKSENHSEWVVSDGVSSNTTPHFAAEIFSKAYCALRNKNYSQSDAIFWADYVTAQTIQSWTFSNPDQLENLSGAVSCVSSVTKNKRGYYNYESTSIGDCLQFLFALTSPENKKILWSQQGYSNPKNTRAPEDNVGFKKGRLLSTHKQQVNNLVSGCWALTASDGLSKLFNRYEQTQAVFDPQDLLDCLSLASSHKNIEALKKQLLIEIKIRQLFSKWSSEKSLKITRDQYRKAYALASDGETAPEQKWKYEDCSINSEGIVSRSDGTSIAIWEIDNVSFVLKKIGEEQKSLREKIGAVTNAITNSLFKYF